MWKAYGKAKDDIDMAEQFERLPTIDIVRCKDCKYFQEGWVKCKMSKLNWADGDWFCADGARGENNG